MNEPNKCVDSFLSGSNRSIMASLSGVGAQFDSCTLERMPNIEILDKQQPQYPGKKPPIDNESQPPDSVASTEIPDYDIRTRTDEQTTKPITDEPTLAHTERLGELSRQLNDGLHIKPYSTCGKAWGRDKPRRTTEREIRFEFISGLFLWSVFGFLFDLTRRMSAHSV